MTISANFVIPGSTISENTYTFFLCDGSSTPPNFEIAILPDTQAATLNALRLLDERSRYSSVEIFDGQHGFVVERHAT
jgi:hypothetical protein